MEVDTTTETESEDSGPSPASAVPGPEVSLPRRPRVGKRAQETLIVKRLWVESLRGYTVATLPIGGFSVVVGNNNQGKSSILRIADWLFNEADDELLLSKRLLSQSETALLVPANQTDHRARRFTVVFQFDDARRARSYRGDAGLVQLRLSVEKTARRARLNFGPPVRGEIADPRAVELLDLARSSIQIVVVPAARDARSPRFRSGLEQRLRELFLKRFGHDKQGGTHAEYRKAKRIVNDLRKMVDEAGADIAGELSSTVPQDMLRSARLTLDASPKILAEWIRERVSLVLSTGVHDEDHVSTVEVGNGLQSVIDVALSIASCSDSARQVVLAIEEPETFLHPAAQRAMAETLRRKVVGGTRQMDVMVTSHSPYFVDEARYGETILVRGHRFYPPEVAEEIRSEINTALMHVGSAEVFFGRGVLLVEGEGDRSLFRTLLRRIRSVVNKPELDHLVVQAMGGKTTVAPWWKLLSSYGRDGDRPIEWICLLDGDAATKSGGERSLIRSFQDIGIHLSSTISQKIVEFGDMDFADTEKRLTTVTALNRVLLAHRAMLFAVDCEWASFGAYAEVAPTAVASILGFEGDPGPEPARTLAIHAGSKVDGGKGHDKKKQPFRRQKLAEALPLTSLPQEIESVLRAWIGLVLTKTAVDQVFEDVGESMSSVCRSRPAPT